MPRLFIDLATLPGEGEPALSWIQVVPQGRWTHPQYGEIVLGERELQEFLEAYQARAYGVDLAVDFAHREEDGAAGWIQDLQRRNGGLFAQVAWTPRGQQALQDREYRYFSPDWVEGWTDAQGKKWPRVLRGGALTVRPFFKELEEIRIASEGIVWTFAQPQWKAHRIDLPLHEDRDYAWDADAAKGRLREWADGDWGKYRKGFLVYDAANPDQVGSYKLPVADVLDGEARVIPRAVSAVLAVLHGGRGGVDLPADVQADCEKETQRLMDRMKEKKKMAEEQEQQGQEQTPPSQGQDGRTVQLTEVEYQRLLGVVQENERRTLADAVATLQFSDGNRRKTIAPASRTALVEALAEVPLQYREKLLTALGTVQLYEPGEAGVGKPPAADGLSDAQKEVNRQLGIDEKTFAELNPR